MGFKIEKQAEAEPEYCEYVQEKIDIAKENGAVYELVDEDYRIQALYDQENLVKQDKIKVINRVRSTQDGKEYLVVNKNVDFFTPDPEDAEKPGVYRDRYSTREGIVELPLKSRNQDTGEVETKATRLVYTIPFSAGKVDEYLEKAEGQGSIPQLTFYEGATSSTRLPASLPAVANNEYFKDANWTELQIGREKKVLNSMMNRLDEVRAEIKTKGGPIDKKVTEEKGIDEKKPSEKEDVTEPKEEVNKLQQNKDSYESRYGQHKPGGGTKKS